jgi:hypothetical protein
MLKLTMIAGLVIALSCCEEPKAKSYYTKKCPKSQIAPDEISAQTSAFGRWRLVWIAPAWGKHSRPNGKIEFVIDNQLGAVLYQNNKEVSRYQFKLQKMGNAVGYTIINQTIASQYVPSTKGIFRACDKELIVGDSYIDGVDQIYDRIGK